MFFFWYASSNNLVGTTLKKMRLFPEEVPYLGKEMTLVLLCPVSGYLSSGQVIDYVRIPGFLEHGQDALVWEILV